MTPQSKLILVSQVQFALFILPLGHRFNGSQFAVWVDVNLILTMPKAIGTGPQGGAGFQIRATTTQFDFMLIYL